MSTTPVVRRRRSVSRRAFLRQSFALSLYASAAPRMRAAAPFAKVFAYAGSYTTPPGGNGKGISLFSMNPANGELEFLELAAPAHDPSWLAFHPSRNFLYAGNEGHNGSVGAYAIDRPTGRLRLLNEVSSQGAGPAHVSVEATGKFLFVANYAGGNVAVLPIDATGALGNAVCVVADKGSLGPTIPASAPPGSFAFSGHDGPHAHMVHADPGNRFVLHTDLGQDRIYVHRFDAATGQLTPAALPFVTVPPGDGPRHFVFHPNGRWFYALQEEASTVIFFHYDPAAGALQPQQTLSALPPGFKGTSFTSEILLSPDGRYLYAANRLHDTVAIFSVGEQGSLAWLGEASTMGSYPRHIQLAPGGGYLYACNQRSDSISCLRRDDKTGGLTFTGSYTALGSPACLVFLG